MLIDVFWFYGFLSVFLTAWVILGALK